MALPALINGADCGPINPLQSLSKQFDRDRSIQQDHFGPGRAGPSREVFRTQTAPGRNHEEAAQFFLSAQASGATFTPQDVVPNSFDLSLLRSSLPQQQIRVHPPPSAWVGDFLKQSAAPTPNRQFDPELHVNLFDSSRSENIESQYRVRTLPMNNTFVSGLIRPQTQTEHFITQADFPPEETQKQEPYSEPVDADELSRTAGLLIETVKEETNPKFQNSAFLGLMRQLRDKEMVVEGTEMVKAHASSEWAQDFASQADVKGKGKAKAENGWADAFQETFGTSPTTSGLSHTTQQKSIHQAYQELATTAPEELHARRHPQAVVGMTRKSVHFDYPEVLGDRATVSVDHIESGAENADDKFWREENAEYQKYWNAPRPAETLHTPPEWDKLQADWDRFEATATGIKSVSVYPFQPNNPYLLGDFSTRNHAIHTQQTHTNQSILEKEAAVQNDIRNPVAWFELGVKQQENEREPNAILALQRAVELDPSYLEAWLALAISYTNDGDRNGAYDAVELWVRNNPRYEDGRFMALWDKGETKTASERHDALIQCLVGLARAAPDGMVDADIQTALGVLLNTGEDYEKAHDCFRAALAVRPNDWLLYNRVGATLANSGRSEDALWYYYRALELNPSYIRARFNLGISCINMKRCNEAAEHILDALVLQENDASAGTDARGITSSALWECLRTTCLQLQKPELAALCDSHDLEGFRKAYWHEGGAVVLE